MALALDHIFVVTSSGAPQADHLSGIGLIEGTSNVHSGQGTANRRFFLDNFTVELLYVNNVVCE